MVTINEDTRAKKIELIRQLLAKAESTTPAEAEALSASAERLMTKYMIDSAMLQQQSERPTEKIITRTVEFKGAFRLEWIQLGADIAAGLGTVKCLQSRYKNKLATLYMVGFTSDVDAMQILFNSLKVQAQVAVRDWWAHNKGLYAGARPYDQEAARRSFVRGFSSGVKQRLVTSRQEIIQTVGTGTELALLSRTDQVAAAWSQMAGKPMRTRGSKGSLSAATSGYRAGQQADTGGQTLTQGRGITA